MNYFFCLSKNTDKCNKTMVGVPACEYCSENVCKNCGRLNTSFCLKCEKSVLSDEMKGSLEKAFLKRRNI